MENTSKTLQFQEAASIETAAKPVSLGEEVKRKIRRNIYQWHRIIGLVVIIPTLFWTVSGVMHPFMSHWFKPTIANEFYKPQTVKADEIKIALSEVLTKNNIPTFKNFRLVKFEKGSFYQVKRVDNRLQYFSVIDGTELADGDKLYAESMARTMLDDQTSKITTIEQINEFTSEYKYVNRLLPVWKVSFDRPDGMDMYVETEQSRLGTFNNNQRKAFIWVFSTFHNWDFLNKISNNTARISIMILFLSIIILSTLSGLVVYGLMWNKFKTPRTGDKVGFLRKYHRQIGLATSLVTLLFAFSGAYHATTKFTPDNRLNFVYEPAIKTSEVVTASIMPLEGATNISLVKMEDKLYWQTFKKDFKTKEMKFDYIDVQTQEKLKDGNLAYNSYLAGLFAEQFATGKAVCCEMGETASASENEGSIVKTKWFTAFENREYGFANKRLPVMGVSMAGVGNPTYYIEPATSRMSARIEDSNRREGWSFALLHKYFLMDWAGKNIRDGVMTFAAFGVLVVSLFGLAVFLKLK